MVRGAVVGLGVALVLTTAGCGSDDDPSPTATPTTGPAEVYFETAFGRSVEEEAEVFLRQEELVAACMAEQGFEYVPDTSTYHRDGLSELDYPPGTREFAAQYGYGIASMPGKVVGDEPSTNAEITAAMSEEELDAYERALNGDAVVDGDEDAELGGCVRAARNEVWGDRELDPVRASLEDEIARIDTELAPADDAVIAAAAEWSACMADAGFPGYATPDAAEEAAWQRWLAFNEGLVVDPLGNAPVDGSIPGQDQMEAEEAALATADWDCRAEADYDAVWREVRNRFQQEYVDAHRAELDAWVERISK